MGEQKEAINSKSQKSQKSKIPYEKRQQKIYNQVRIYKKKKKLTPIKHVKIG